MSVAPFWVRALKTANEIQVVGKYNIRFEDTVRTQRDFNHAKTYDVHDSVQDYATQYNFHKSHVQAHALSLRLYCNYQYGRWALAQVVSRDKRGLAS